MVSMEPVEEYVGEYDGFWYRVSLDRAALRNGEPSDQGAILCWEKYAVHHVTQRGLYVVKVALNEQNVNLWSDHHARGLSCARAIYVPKASATCSIVPMKAMALWSLHADVSAAAARLYRQAKEYLRAMSHITDTVSSLADEQTKEPTE